VYIIKNRKEGDEHDKIKNKGKTMLNNKQIVEKIRTFGKKTGLNTDMAICEKCDFTNRAQIRNMLSIKTAPQLDTLNKFARGLGVEIEDLIYDRTDADIELSQLLAGLSEFEKTEVIVYIRMMRKEKNKEISKAA